MTILEDLRTGVSTASAEETRWRGEQLASALPPDATLALHGDLGVGKTTFVQGLALGFGLSTQVTSPTFNILHLYRNAPPPVGATPLQSPRQGAASLTLVHFDAYRLENARQIEALMLDDFLVSPYCLAVEWPERIAEWLPAATWHLTLAIESRGQHRLTLRLPGDVQL
jgi:tRNA threonylcarbamoyladenosine biosynthesis protein TsaE